VDERDLADLERRVRDSVAGDLRAALSALERNVVVIYTAVAGDTRHKLPEAAQDTLRGHLLDVLDDLAARNYRTTRNVLIGAARAGLAGGGGDLGVEVDLRLPADLREALHGLTVGMREDLKQARQLARRGALDRYGDAQAVIAAAKKALNRADRGAVWVVHRAHNEGRSRAIDRMWRQGVQVQQLWRAERDACPACLSFAGALAEPGEPFRPVVQVADPSARPDGLVAGPPLHPHCRCELDWWTGAPEADLGPLDLPHALRREAQRSILTGEAQGAKPARLRAADRLVDMANLLVPKTVVKRARKAINAGRFPK
jgi:hypothetical protein